MLWCHISILAAGLRTYSTEWYVQHSTAFASSSFIAKFSRTYASSCECLFCSSAMRRHNTASTRRDTTVRTLGDRGHSKDRRKDRCFCPILFARFSSKPLQNVQHMANLNGSKTTNHLWNTQLANFPLWLGWNLDVWREKMQLNVDFLEKESDKTPCTGHQAVATAVLLHKMHPNLT